MVAFNKKSDWDKLINSLPVLIAAAAIVWGASKIDSRVASIETWITANADTQIKIIQQSDHQKILEDNQKIIMHDLQILREANNVGKDKDGH